VGAVTDSAPDDDLERATELADRARELHAQKAYYEARELYEQSLELRDDASVRAAYHKLMATIGPK
jgi:hypothetical protein